MNPALARLLGSFLRQTGLQYWPVTVRAGLAAGARWTAYPWSAYWRGRHEPELHAAIAALGDLTGWSCWDLGAHYGIYSVGLARRVGPTGSVAAFEPNPASYARLRRHRDLNGLAWLHSFELAASDQTGTAEMYTYGELESTTTHLPYGGETPGPETCPVTIQIARLDDLVTAGSLALPNLVKVDVEGHAHRALRGAAESLRQSRPILIIAMHAPDEFAGCREVLEPLGYNWTVIATPSGSSDPVIGHDLLFRM